MKRTDPKDSASAVVLLSQKNKKAFYELYKLYARDVYYICCVTAGVTYELSDEVTEVFLRLWRECESVTADNFEDLLFTLSVGVCRSRQKHSVLPREDKTLGVYDEIKNVPSFEDIRKSFMTFEPSAYRPDMRAVSFYNEMISSMPEKNREILMLSAFTSLSAEDIAKSEAVDADFVRNNLRESYSFLIHQAKRADFMGYKFVGYIPRLAVIIDALSRTCTVPKDIWMSIAQSIGYDENEYNNEEKKPEPIPIREIPKVKKKVSPTAKRVIAVISALLIVICASAAGVYINKNKKEPESVLPETEENNDNGGVWNGETGDKFLSGSGTKDDPYIISDGGQLAYLSSVVNSGNVEYFACCYALGGDIVLNNADTNNIFTPIGYRNSDSDYKYFCGEFDGRGYSITGLKTDASSCSGLFGYLNDAKIRNINLVSCDVSAENYAGGIAGYYSAKSGSAGISSCDVSGKISSESYAGGIVGFVSVIGQSSSFSVDKCSSEPAVSASVKSAGGIIGYLEVSDGEANIIDCMNSGDISSNDNAGGIVGANQLLNGSSAIKTCINVGKITCKNATYGAIAGISDGFSAQSRARIENCIYLDSSSDKAVNSGENSYVNAAAITRDQFSQSINFDGFDTDKIWNVSAGSFPSLR